MKTLEEIRESSHSPEYLEERLLRKGMGVVYASQSKKYGNAATRHFNNATLHLNRPVSNSDEQINNLSDALKEVVLGLKEMRNQNGSITALGLVAVLLSEKSQKSKT